MDEMGAMEEIQLLNVIQMRIEELRDLRAKGDDTTTKIEEIETLFERLFGIEVEVK